MASIRIQSDSPRKLSLGFSLNVQNIRLAQAVGFTFSHPGSLTKRTWDTTDAESPTCTAPYLSVRIPDMEKIISKPVVDLRFKKKRVGSLGWVLFTAVLLAQAQPASTPVLRSFDRVQLLEEKGETSAGVSLGDLNGDGLPDIVLGKGRHWPLFNRVLLNDGHGGFIASNLGTEPDRTYSAALQFQVGESLWKTKHADTL